MESTKRASSPLLFPLWRRLIQVVQAKRAKRILRQRNPGVIYDCLETVDKQTASCLQSSTVGEVPGTEGPQLAELRRVFACFDENSDGLISSEELRQFMKRLGLEMTAEEVQDILRTVDQNSDDSLDFEEFLSAYKFFSAEEAKEDTLAAKEDDEGSLLQAFSLFDTNHDGLISSLELQHVLVNLGMPEGNSLKNCERMIAQVDVDGNGQVDFNEFRVMMFSKAFQS